MASTTAFAGEHIENGGRMQVLSADLSVSIDRLVRWLKRNDHKGYDTFDGLNALYLRPLTIETRFLRTVLLQGVRRFPINLRPLLGIRKSYSSKGMGFLARGYMRLHSCTNDQAWADEAKLALGG